MIVYINIGSIHYKHITISNIYIMYILLDEDDINIAIFNQYEIVGSWNNWTKSIKLEDYNFSMIVETEFKSIRVYIYKIDTTIIGQDIINIIDNKIDETCKVDDILIYKLKYKDNDNYILLPHILTIHINGYDNNKIVKDRLGHYFNGKYKIKNYNNKLEILYNTTLIFEGSSVKGIPNGNGVHYDVNKNKIYEGNWYNGYYSGYGTNYNITNIVMYKGYWLHGVPNGNGISYDDNGNIIYEGEWKNGLNHGIGKQYHKNGNIEYEGEWKDDCCNGNGKLYDIYGNLVYDGEWKNNCKNGYGLLYILPPNKVNNTQPINNAKLINNVPKITYKGEWVNNKKSGSGTSFYENDNRHYIGGWLNDLWHGYGICYNVDGSIKLEGMWNNNAIT